MRTAIAAVALAVAVILTGCSGNPPPLPKPATTSQPSQELITEFFAWLAKHPGTIHIYDGRNKGVTVDNCGFELIGAPGPFCNVD